MHFHTTVLQVPHRANSTVVRREDFTPAALQELGLTHFGLDRVRRLNADGMSVLAFPPGGHAYYGYRQHLNLDLELKGTELALHTTLMPEEIFVDREFDTLGSVPVLVICTRYSKASARSHHPRFMRADDRYAGTRNGY